jgi:hypothetical protein
MENHHASARWSFADDDRRLHLLADLIFYPQPLVAIAQDGLLDAVNLNPAQFDRGAMQITQEPGP